MKLRDFLFYPLLLVYILLGFAPFVIAEEKRDDELLTLVNKVGADLACIRCLVEELRYTTFEQNACYDCTIVCKENTDETK